jgi:DNA repair exonuclease SbcCD ATPase subunit
MSEATKFLELTRMKYVDQAKWYLNGFWGEGASQESENIWKYTNKFIDLDDKMKKNGCELDEFQAHKFLESLGETMTVIALRERLKKIDLDCNGKMALLEYLCFKYNKTIKQIINAPQGENPEEVKKAAEKLNLVQEALNEIQKQLEEQKKQEELVKIAEAESRAAVDDLHKQEESYHNAISVLDAKSKDPSVGTVAKSKAAAELAQLKGSDPLPLRKAKITQEASLRKVEKERKSAEEQTRKVEEAVKQTEARVKEAEDYLESIKNKGGNPMGSIWWMERELIEAQKYLPKNKKSS